MTVVTDDSVDAEGLERLPLYIGWKGKRLRVASLERQSYFSINRKGFVELPHYEEVAEILSGKDDVKVVLPSKPANLLKQTVNFVSSFVGGIETIEAKMDAVSLSMFLKSGRSLESIDSFSKRSRTYLLLSDLSLLRKNDVLSERHSSRILTKVVNVVKFSRGNTVVRSTWSVKSAVSMIFDEMKAEENSTVVIRHSGRGRLANMLATRFVSEYGQRVSLGWMNPVVAAQYGHNTVTVTIVPEV